MNSILEADDECSTVASVDSNLSRSSKKSIRRSMKQPGISLLGRIFEQREIVEESIQDLDISEDQSMVEVEFE